MTDARRVAVVGSGVSGLTAAYLLRESHEVTLFEADDRLGGHAHTHDVLVGSQIRPVDSGFIVLNDRTYPLLRRLFDQLGVVVRPTEMSMSISCRGCGLGYVGGRGVGGIFAQRRRVVDPRYLRLLAGVARFRREARRHAERFSDSPESYGDFLERLEFTHDLIQHFAIPLVSCVWSSGTTDALNYPAAHLFAFLRHHGFLDVRGAPQWFTVAGGSRAYVQAIADKLPDVRTGRPVTSITRGAAGVELTTASGSRVQVDRVVVATHADQALGLLADPTPEESSVLGTFHYSRNTVQIHRDRTLLPERVRGRASWNIGLDSCEERPERARVSYWMNRLHGYADPGDRDPIVVTLNAAERIDASRVIAQMSYEHPIFTAEAVAAQWRLRGLNTDVTAFAGAYHGWGFHEDGCRAGIAAAVRFGATW